MKSGKFSIELIKIMVNNLIKKRRKTYPPHIFNERINIPYLNDKNQYHTYDVYLANKENRKNICVIDIHGGAYIFGKHQDNYPYAYEFLNAGFDVVLLDYVPNNGKRDISDIVSDCVSNLKHLFQNLEEYGLKEDVFFMAGDSAGGHLALLLSEAIRRKEVASILNIELPDVPLKGVVVNSPAYDFENLGEGVLSKSGFKRLFGPKYFDKEHLRKYSPKTYMEEFDLPIFLSTCKNDFIRSEPMMLYNEIKNRPNLVFVDIDSDDKEVDHVHNVTKPLLVESKKVNNLAISFMEKYYE